MLLKNPIYLQNVTFWREKQAFFIFVEMHFEGSPVFFFFNG